MNTERVNELAKFANEFNEKLEKAFEKYNNNVNHFSPY